MRFRIVRDGTYEVLERGHFPVKGNVLNDVVSDYCKKRNYRLINYGLDAGTNEIYVVVWDGV